VDEMVTSTVAWTKLLLDAIAQTGLDPKRLCEAADIDFSVFQDHEARIPTDKITRLWDEAAKQSQDPNIGLHVGEKLKPRAVNVVSYLLLSSPTVREGLERVIRYSQLATEALIISLEDQDDLCELQFDLVGGQQPRSRHPYEYLGVLLMKFSQWITDREFKAVETRFRHPQPADISEHQRIFRSPLLFSSDVNCLVVQRELLERPSVHADPDIFRLHEEFAKRHLAGLEDHSTVRQVKMHLASLLERGPRDLDSIAQRLNTSPRTLQRRLSEENTTFQDVLDDIRKDVCMDHLENTSMPVAEVAYLAGFADPSTFYRAFKRWTGMTPLEFRESRQKAGAASRSSTTA